MHQSSDSESTRYHARSEFGQHFLQSESAAECIAETVENCGISEILEVGAGLGLLSETVCRLGLNLTAVEIDERLEAGLVRRLAPFGKRARVILGNFLELNDILPCQREVTFVSIVPFQLALAEAIVRKAHSGILALRGTVLVGPDLIVETFHDQIANLERVYSLNPGDFWPPVSASIGVYKSCLSAGVDRKNK